MKYLKKLKHFTENEKNDNEYLTYQQNRYTHFAHVDIKKLDDILKIFKEYAINYSLHLLENTKDIGLFIIMSIPYDMIQKIKQYCIYVSDNIDTIKKVKDITENITHLSISEIQEKIDIFELTKKYNI